MTLSEANEKASQLQHHLGKQVGNSQSIAQFILACPTNEKERIDYVTNVGTGLYSPEQALTFVRTDDFDVIIIFHHPMSDVVNASWFTNFLPLP